MNADSEKSPVEVTIRYYEGPVTCPSCHLVFYPDAPRSRAIGCPRCNTNIKIIRDETSVVRRAYDLNDYLKAAEALGKAASEAAGVQYVSPKYAVAECPKCHCEIRCEYNGHAISNPVGCPNCFQVIKVYN